MENNTVYFLWDNFGPLHADRCDAVATHLKSINVVGVELYSRSNIYSWNPEHRDSFSKYTLFEKGNPRGLSLVVKLIATAFKSKKGSWFVCHYEKPEILFFAFILRILGVKVFTMGCSKFDDFKRRPLREFFKTFFFLPYSGALGSGTRSIDYYKFLGFSNLKVAGDYNCVSHERIRSLSGSQPAPFGTSFADRHFTIVARLVPKKNIFMALDSYAMYANMVDSPRDLNIYGDGPLEHDLKKYWERIASKGNVNFMGFAQSSDIAKCLANTLSLLLPSTEEQFGNVVPEAQAMGIPVIISRNCGASDVLVKSGVNGFVIEDSNAEGLSWFMSLLSDDEQLWRRMCHETNRLAPLGDITAFVGGVKKLLGL